MNPNTSLLKNIIFSQAMKLVQPIARLAKTHGLSKEDFVTVARLAWLMMENE